MPADVDPDGWDIDAHGATLRQSSPRLAYLIADFQNPTGLLMTDEQRAELAAHVRRDPHDRRVRRGPPATSPCAPGLAASDAAPLAAHCEATVTIGSASKSLLGRAAPGLAARPAAR